jgi:hypothetical protein
MSLLRADDAWAIPAGDRAVSRPPITFRISDPPRTTAAFAPVEDPAVVERAVLAL